MKTILIFAAAATALFFSSCNTSSKSPKTETDSLAYYIGLDMGRNLKQFDSTLNVDMVAVGVKDYFKGKSKITDTDVQAFLNDYFQVRLPKILKKESEDFLSKVEKETKGIQKTESGILYVIENPGSAVKAVNDSDEVRVIYHGTLPNGKVFDSSREKGDTVAFPLNRVIKGWTEGMKLIGEGGKIKLWIPSDLGYGEYGQPQAGIKQNQALVFEVDLISVTPAPAEEPVK